MNQPVPQSSSPIAGSVLPIKRAEELLTTLPGVIAARIVAGDNGAVDEIHVLTSADVTPKQTVRNIESALIAHLGMRVDHRKISVATTTEQESGKKTADAAKKQAAVADVPAAIPGISSATQRRLYFEDVEVRRSRSKGVACRVTLRKGEESYVGEAEGIENERSRIELAARAALTAIRQAEGEQRVLALEGAKIIEAFEKEFVFVGITARVARESMLLTGSCEIKDSAETASVLAVLDSTNRWMAHSK